MEDDLNIASEQKHPRITPRQMEAIMARGLEMPALQLPSIPGLLSSEEEEAAQQEIANQFFEQALAAHQQHLAGLLGGSGAAKRSALQSNV